MKFSHKFFLLLFIGTIIAAVGCVPRYAINVTGYLDTEKPFSFTTSNTFSVVQNTEAENPLLEKEVSSKISKLLEDKGFPQASAEEADFHIVYWYLIEQGPLHTDSIPINQSIFFYDPYIGTWSFNPVTTYQTYSVQHYTRSLSVRVIDAHKSRDSNQAEVIWAADTVSEGGSRDLREILNYLLVATFNYFGQDTGKQVRLKLTPKDPQVIQLMQK